MQEASRQRRRRLSGRRLCAAASAVAITATSSGLVPASATLVPGEPIAANRNITVFHNIDFVAVFGWPLGVPITVSVIRDGVTIGNARGPSVATPDGPGLEVNHGPAGRAQPGDCWNGQTPDIQPGDKIQVTNGTARSSVIVDDITFSGPAEEDVATGDILVRGVAKFANGDPMPAAKLDSSEFRDDSNGQLRGVPTRTVADPAVEGGFIMVYEPPYNLERNRGALNEAQRKASLLNSGGHATGFGHVAVLPRESMLVDGLTDTPGPALGCDGTIDVSRPTSPASIRATAGNHTAAVAWTRPAFDGNAAITGYRLRVLRGATVVRRVNVGNVNRRTVRRLANGVRYRFEVLAVNRVGRSLPSPRSNTVVPRR